MKKKSEKKSLEYRDIKDRITRAVAAGCPIETKWFFIGEIFGLATSGKLTFKEDEELYALIGYDVKDNADAYDYAMLGCLSDDLKDEDEDPY